MRFSLRSLLVLVLVMTVVLAGISLKLKQDARRASAFETLENLGIDYNFTFSNTNELHFRLQSPDFNQDDLSTFVDCVKTLTYRYDLIWSPGNVIGYINFELITLTNEQVQFLRRHFPNVPIDFEYKGQAF